MCTRTGQREIGQVVSPITLTRAIKWFIRTRCIEPTGIQIPYLAVMLHGPIWVHVVVQGQAARLPAPAAQVLPAAQAVRPQAAQAPLHPPQAQVRVTPVQVQALVTTIRS